MSWQDRIRTAAYTPPSGEPRIEFDYESVARVTEKRTTAFSFRGINDNYIQDNGYGSRKYAMRCIFSGDDHDKNATVFEAALLESGVGKLDHPLYGTFDVVPFGSISRTNELVVSANQSVIDCEFWTTTGVVYPTAEKSPRNEVLASIEDYKIAQSASYDEAMEVDSTTQQQSLRGTVDGAIAIGNDTLSVIPDANVAAMQEFRAWQQTINTGINSLVGTPVLLAQQMINMFFAPARAVSGIANKFVAYGNFLQSIFASAAAQPSLHPSTSGSPKLQVRQANDFRTADLTAQAALVAMALAAVETTFTTKPDAIGAADDLFTRMAEVAAWRDAGYAAFTQSEYGARINVLDDGEAWQATQRTVALCAGYLVQISFTVLAERRMVLDRPRTIIDLCAELYGVVDSQLDFLIDSNELTGAEILELPRGREVVWYS